MPHPHMIDNIKFSVVSILYQLFMKNTMFLKDEVTDDLYSFSYIPKDTIPDKYQEEAGTFGVDYVEFKKESGDYEYLDLFISSDSIREAAKTLNANIEAKLVESYKGGDSPEGTVPQFKINGSVSGAGFPAVPIKIAFPSIKVTLIDSLNKRIKFLNEVISVLGLEDIEAVHSRAEEGAMGKYRESFDIVVSRAVANLSTLSEYCLPYVKVGGVFVAYKSEELLNPRKITNEELAELDRANIKYALATKSEKEVSSKAISILGGKIEEIYEYSLIDNYRCLCVIRKEKATPKKYPRKAGLPGKEPIF